MIARLLFFLFCLLGSAAAAYYGQPLARGNTDVNTIIITVLTVFAGFIIAIVAILGDPSLIPAGSWRAAEIRRDTVESRLVKHIWLFSVYLISIGLLFIGALLAKADEKLVSETFRIWIERSYLFAGVFSFLLTFALPASLLRYQMSRVDAEIDRRRAAAGIKDTVDEGPHA